MATTQNTYTGDGSTTNFTLTFPYIAAADVRVSLNAVDTTAFTLTNATTVSFTTAPANGVAIRIYRVTDDSNNKIFFNSGSTIKASDLNDAVNRNLFLTQETNANISNVSAGSVTDGSIGTSKLADGAVTSAKLSATAVTSGSYTAADITVDTQGRITSASNGVISTTEIADNAVTAAKIPDSSIVTGKLADNAVTTAKITDDAVTTAKIADDAVTSSLIADSAVTTALIANNAVTNAKLDSDLQQKTIKAWIRFNPSSSNAVADKYNISTITEVDTGFFRFNFTNSMPNTNYGFVGTAEATNSSHDNTYHVTLPEGSSSWVSSAGGNAIGLAITTSYLTVEIVKINSSGYRTTTEDPDFVSVLVFGD